MKNYYGDLSPKLEYLRSYQFLKHVIVENFLGEKFHNFCLICNSSQLSLLIGYEKFPLAKCKSCGLVFMKKIPTLGELNVYYNTYCYSVETKLSPITIKRYHELLDEFEAFRKTNKLLDVGCGVGGFLEIAKIRGWEVYGTEHSNTAVDLCKKKGITMISGKLEINNFERNHFDIITSFEVIEHINNPVENIKFIKHWLRENGVFYCTTPNFNNLLRYYLKDKFDMICYPEHLVYYSKSTLNKLLTEQGFKLKKIGSTGFSLSILKLGIGKSNEKILTQNSTDEIIRRSIEKKWYMFLVSKFINFIFTLTNTGMTLKGII